MFAFVEEKIILAENEKIDFSKPIIGYMPDWRTKINPETKKKTY